MRISNQSSQRTALVFNITPLIDVVFLLIIFFLVASHFVRHEKASAVSLPVSQQGASDEQSQPHRLTFTINAQGVYSLAGRVQSEQAIVQQIMALNEQSLRSQLNPEVRIRCDQHAEYVHLRKLIEKCAAQNLRRIQFAVVREPSGSRKP